jgi:hypothetical protein
VAHPRTTVLFGALAFLGVVAWPERALSYCRARTCQDDAEADFTCRRTSRRCISEGTSLHYDTACLTFAVARQGVEPFGLKPAEFEAIVSNAFRRWQEVDCGKRQTPGVFVMSAGLVDATEPYYCDEASLNVGVWFLTSNWSENLDPEAFGNTGAVFSEKTGRVLDADVLLNGAKLLQAAPEGTLEEVLLSIATHEAGHVLGLDHSDDPNAIMAAGYHEGELVGRKFAPDDVDGICEIWPPEGFPKTCSEPGVPEGALGDRACRKAMAAAEEEETQPISASNGSCAVVATRSPSALTFWSWLLALVSTGLMARRSSAGRAGSA